MAPHSLTLLLGHLGQVELELRTLKNVPVAPATLARAGCDACVDAASVKLLLDLLCKHTGSLTLLQLALNMVGPLDLDICVLLLANLDAIVLLIPLLESSTIDLHDATLHKGVCTDQLIICRVVHNVEHADLAGYRFRSPREVSSVQAERTILLVTTTSADGTDTRGVANLCVGRLTTKLIFAVHLPFGELTSSLAALVE